MSFPSKATPAFWNLYHSLPGEVKKAARKAFHLWSTTPPHNLAQGHLAKCPSVVCPRRAPNARRFFFLLCLPNHSLPQNLTPHNSPLRHSNIPSECWNVFQCAVRITGDLITGLNLLCSPFKIHHSTSIIKHRPHSGLPPPPAGINWSLKRPICLRAIWSPRRPIYGFASGSPSLGYGLWLNLGLGLSFGSILIFQPNYKSDGSSPVCLARKHFRPYLFAVMEGKNIVIPTRATKNFVRTILTL